MALILLAGMGLISSCSGARMLLQTAPETARNVQAMPPLNVRTTAEWNAQNPLIKSAFETEVYGTFPARSETLLQDKREITNHEYTDITIEELDLTLSYTRENKINSTTAYTAVLLTPSVKQIAAGQSAPPIIMIESFCPVHNVIPAKGISKPQNLAFSCDSGSLMARLMKSVFGRYIISPPIKDILARGYGLAVIYPSHNFPDNAESFAAQQPAAQDGDSPWGAVAAWALQFSSLSQTLSDLGYETTIAYGHSRYGKAALLAAAFDPSIDAVIAHQSGTGGASLSRNKKGESVASITKNYPHWFTPAYSEKGLSYDQHHLLALIAPRPILLGNAQRDVWSDPEGAFHAAKAASPAYALFGSTGLSANTLKDFKPGDDIAFWMRKGTHGVVKEDWPAFLSFLDAHFH